MIIGIGTDIIEIHRIEEAMGKTPSFFEKIFTEKERIHYKENHKKVESLAGFFAAKEAVSKALGTGFRGYTPCDIEVIPDELGKPEIVLLGGAKERGIHLGVKRIFVSISHCREYATAYVVLEGGN